MIPAIALIILSFVVILIAIITLTKYKKISATGIEAEGVIFDMESSSTSSDATVTYPIIRFLTEKNEWITQKASVSIIPGSYKKGQTITVVYLKDNPTAFFIKSNWTNGVLAIMIIGGLALFTYGIYLLINI
jgi:cell shape-determining protein MreD